MKQIRLRTAARLDPSTTNQQVKRSFFSATRPKPGRAFFQPIGQRAAASHGVAIQDVGGRAAPEGTSRGIKARVGQGKPLDRGVRAGMERGFGADFSRVRVHTDQPAHRFNRELGAQAFTLGEDIFFRNGKFRPETSAGKHLLAHELTHVIQQQGPGLQREAETDPRGNYTGNYIFRPNPFFRRVKRDIADGPLTQDEIEALRLYALARNGTVQHVEILLMAAMRNAANATLLRTHSGGNFTLPMSSIAAADRAFVLNVGREAVPAEITLLQMRRFMAQAGLSAERVAELTQEIDDLAAAQITAHGEPSFTEQAERLSVYLFDPPLSPAIVLRAMLNAAADSTSGDKIMAGTAYAVARNAGHPMATELLSGRLKVDALIPRVYRRLRGSGDASYQYSTDSDLATANTLYLPTSLNIFEITDRALIIHELTHAEDDLTTARETLRPEIDLETRAYLAQARYVLDGIRALAVGTRPGLLTSASRQANSSPLFYWAFVRVAKGNTATYQSVLTEILTTAPTSQTNAQVAAALALPLATINRNLRTGILGIRGAGGRPLYSAARRTRLGGSSGHFFQ